MMKLMLIPDSKLLALKVAQYYRYDEKSAKTDEVLGVKYTVGDEHTFERYTIKVPGTSTPIVTQAKIDESPERIYLTFDDIIAKPYKNHRGDIELSLTATSVSLAK